VNPTFTIFSSMSRQYFSVAGIILLSHFFYMVDRCKMNFWGLFLEIA